MAGAYNTELLHTLTNAQEEPEYNVIFWLVQNCIDLNAMMDNKSALHIVAERNYLNSAKILLEANALVNIMDSRGTTPLHVSCRTEHGTQLVRELLKHGAKVNAEDFCKRTPLHIASEYQCINTIQELLKHRAAVNAVNESGNTPLLCGLLFNTKKITVEILVKAGADVNHRNLFGESSLYLALGKHDIVRLLLANKCEANICDNEGNTPLHWAAIEEHVSIKVIKELIKAGANVNVLNLEGNSALDYSLLRCNGEKMRELIRCGATIKLKEYIRFLRHPLTILRFENHINEVSTILKDLITYFFIHSQDSYATLRQQLMRIRVTSLLHIWSTPQCNLVNFRDSCLIEVNALSKISCDCGKSSVWGSITENQACSCDIANARVKFLISGANSNFSDALFYKLRKDFLLETLLNQISFFEYKKTGKRVMSNWDCVKILERFVTFEDVQFALQSEQSVMDATEFNKFIAFVTEDSPNYASSEILCHLLSLFQAVKDFFFYIFSNILRT